jgi:hypothetical protein
MEEAVVQLVKEMMEAIQQAVKLAVAAVELVEQDKMDNLVQVDMVVLELV